MVLLTIVQTTSQQSNSKNEGIIDLIGLSSGRKKKILPIYYWTIHRININLMIHQVI